MTYQIWHVTDQLKDEMLQEFESLNEAREYVFKLADRSILATIKVSA